MHKTITVKLIRLIDITYLTIIYVTISIVFSIYFNKLMGKFNVEETKKKSTTRLILEIYLHFTIIAIAAYLIRELVQQIPFPLDDVHDFDHGNVHELDGGVIFGFAIFYYQINLGDKINYLFNDRLWGHMESFAIRGKNK